MRKWFGKSSDESSTEEQAPQDEVVSIEPDPEPQEETRSVWDKFRTGLSKSRDNLREQLTETFRRSEIDEDLWEEVEEALIGADVGVESTMDITAHLRKAVKTEGIKDASDLWDLLGQEVSRRISGSATEILNQEGKVFYLVVGVNGTGKTTSVAKIARKLSLSGNKVLLAAGDTYRAAAIEQLKIWGERLGVDVIAHQRDANPSAVLFDAIAAAKAREVDTLIADTSGRLHTYENLMGELEKMRRVAERELDGYADLKVLLVIDATTGQNGLIQAKQFAAAVEVDAIILTKLDGTAKGGIVISICDQMDIPIAFTGVGEGMDDLEPFDPALFAEALIGVGNHDDF